MNVMKEIVDTTETIVRHLVCGEIRERIAEITGFSVEELKEMIYDLDPKAVFDILDQIEKGE